MPGEKPGLIEYVGLSGRLRQFAPRRLLRLQLPGIRDDPNHPLPRPVRFGSSAFLDQTFAVNDAHGVPLEGLVKPRLGSELVRTLIVRSALPKIIMGAGCR